MSDRLEQFENMLDDYVWNFQELIDFVSELLVEMEDKNLMTTEDVQKQNKMCRILDLLIELLDLYDEK